MIEVKARYINHPYQHWHFRCLCGHEQEALPPKTPPGSALYSPRKLACGCKLSLVPDMRHSGTRAALQPLKQREKQPPPPPPEPPRRKRRRTTPMDVPVYDGWIDYDNMEVHVVVPLGCHPASLLKTWREIRETQ